MLVLKKVVLDSIKSFVIKQRMRQIRKELSDINLEKVEKQIANVNWRTINAFKKFNIIKELKHSAENSPYYRDKIPELIKGINYKNALSIIPKLPFTTSAEVSVNSKQFLAVPKSEVAGLHFTYGTTGGKKTIYNTKRDLNLINYSYTLGFINCGIEKKDIAQIVYSFGVWQLAEYILSALRSVGIITIPTGNYVSFQDQEEYIEKFGTNVIFGTPSYVYNLSREIDLSTKVKANMKAILVGGEGLPEHRRKVIEEKLGGEVFINYGLNEFGGGIGSECKCHNGYHIFPNVIYEIIDPKTTEPVEREEYGELVLTSLRREAMPLIRYRTGDITRIIDGECDCGLKLPRIDQLKGRTDDRVVIGAAEKYYPIVFDKLFDSVDEIKDYWIEVVSENDRDSLKTYISARKPSEKLKAKILEKFYSLDSLKIDIETTKTVNKPEIIFIDKLPNSAKRRRLVDKRKFKT